MKAHLALAVAKAASQAAHPTNVTWIGLAILLVGGAITVSGVRRNSLKKKAGVAIVGIVIVFVGACLAIFSS
jgi:D-arabinose 1-dehydrogenase-like Zn-dependent alcohol dehydrogenase